MSKKLKIISGFTSFFPLIAAIPFTIFSFMFANPFMKAVFSGISDMFDSTLPFVQTLFPDSGDLALPVVVTLITLSIIQLICIFFNIIFDAIIIKRTIADHSVRLMWIILLVIFNSVVSPVFWCIYIKPRKPEEQTKEADPWQ